MSAKRDTEIDRYTAPSGLASAIGECADEFGIDIVPICRTLDIDPSTFTDLTGRIALDRLCRLLETCALLASDETFGLKTCEYFKSGSTGPYGYGLMVAPTALDFMKFFGEHQQYASSRSFSRIITADNSIEVQLSFSPLIVQRNQFIDMGVGLLMRSLRPILGSQIDLVAVGMERPKPKNPALYREKISRKVSFDRPVNSFKLPAELFGARNPRSDPRLFRLMDMQCRSLKADLPQDHDFTDDLKDFMLLHVADSNVSLREAADYFKVSERTLQRRLADRGTSLNDLRDEVRKDLADKLLAQTDISAGEIAHRLGYSAASAFTRSTIRWFGKTPTEYRKTIS